MQFKRALLVLSNVAIIALALSTASTAKNKSSTFQGYLVDKQCADSVRQDSHPEDFIKHHTKDCALMENCRRNGYTLYVSPNWFDLDKHGSKLAIKVLRNSKRNHGFFVRVDGSVQAGLLRVKSIVETPEPVSQQHAETK